MGSFFLCRRVSAKSDIFANGEAISKNTAFDFHGWDGGGSCTDEVKFSVFFMLLNCTQIVYFIALALSVLLLMLCVCCKCIYA